MMSGKPEDDLLRDFEPEGVEAADDHMESERRLFYVAVTRAKKQLYIGTGGGTGRAGRVASRSPFIDEMQLDKTRGVVEAFLAVLWSKTRGPDDAACQSFVRTCGGLPANGKVARYARDHYVDQLGIPSLRQRVDDAAMQTSADHLAVHVRGDVASVTPPAIQSASAGQSTASWQEFFNHNPDWGRTANRKPPTEPPVPTVSAMSKELYHVTRISNLPSILVAGLLCWDAVNDRASCLPVGENVVQRRIETIPLTGKPVSAYVPLSLCARSPFLHAVTRGSGISDEEIAIVCFDMSRVLSLPGTIYRSTDVQRQAMEFYQAKEFPQHINRCATDAMSYSSGVSGEAEAADVLVQRRIPPELIVGVIVNSDRTLERIQDTLCDLASANPDNDKSYARCMGMLRASPSDFFFSGGTAR
jgi:hypothetical protein